MTSLKLSVLDQSPVHDDQAESTGLFSTIELAKICDQAGYHRYWLAEHHNMPGIASSATAVLIGHIAGGT